MKNNIIRFKNRNTKEGIIMCKKLKELQGKQPNDLLKEYNMQNIIPVDVNKLLEKMNIKTFAIDFEEVESKPEIQPLIQKKGKILGAVLLNKDDIIISYRKTDPTHRKRFTIAHELAHCCLADNLGENFIQFRNDLISSDEMEIKCNTFAGELLIPEYILNELHNVIPVFPLEKLSNIFDVSVSVMAKRLDNLKIPYIKLNGDVEL